MPLSRAEIQKGYRERKKAKEGESYLRKERTRRMKYYVPSAELSTKERKRRNKQNAERVKKHREKRKTEVLQAEEDNIGETIDGHRKREAIDFKNEFQQFKERIS